MYAYSREYSIHEVVPPVPTLLSYSLIIDLEEKNA